MTFKLLYYIKIKQKIERVNVTLLVCSYTVALIANRVEKRNEKKKKTSRGC